jgi:IclR family transcriptional regulator, acetate operon repressor
MKSAERTLDLFEAFASSQKSLSLSELARLMKMPVSTCFGLVRTLESRGYVYAIKPRSGFYPTKRLLDMARVIAAHDPLLERAEPILQELRDKTGETVTLAKRQGNRIIYLDVFESPQLIRYSAQIGEFRSLYTSSAGKAILGSLDEAERREILAGVKLRKYTANSLVTQRDLEADIVRSAKRGWYANMGEIVEDLMAVAIPLKLNDDWYGVSIIGPIYRMQPELEKYLKVLQHAGKALASGR